MLKSHLINAYPFESHLFYNHLHYSWDVFHLTVVIQIHSVVSALLFFKYLFFTCITIWLFCWEWLNDLCVWFEYLSQLLWFLISLISYVWLNRAIGSNGPNLFSLLRYFIKFTDMAFECWNNLNVYESLALVMVCITVFTQVFI